MVLPTSGSLSMAQINQEFGKGTSLSEYRGQFWFKPSNRTTGYFTSTNLGMDQFYGTTPALIIDVYGTNYDFNLRNAVLNSGWNGSSPISIICNVYGYMLASSTGVYAFYTGSYPAGSNLTLNVLGGAVIAGRGGAGGIGAPSGVCGCVPGNPGQQGGPGLILQTPTWLYNYGTISGGGGGGGGGGAECGYIWNASAGGGGGGAPYGTGAGTNGCGVTRGRFGGTGANGALFSGGGGGASGNGITAVGGRGGDLGQFGSAGQTISASGGAGGAPGIGISGIGNFLGGHWGDVRGGTDLFLNLTGNPNANINFWPTNPPYTIDTNVLVTHNNAVPGPYTWNFYTPQYGGVGILSTEYVNEQTRRINFRSTTNSYYANYYSVFTVTVTGSIGIITSTSFGVNHIHESSDPNPPPDGPGNTSCFLPESLVLMADGTQKMIKDVQVGDQLVGGLGYINTVLSIDLNHLMGRPIYWINGDHNTTSEHRHWTTQGWASIDPVATMDEHGLLRTVIVDDKGTLGQRVINKFTQTPIHVLQKGMTFITLNGEEKIESITVDDSYSYNQPVYSLQMSGSHTFTVNGKIVSGWATDEDFDYNTWTLKEKT